MGWAWLGLKSLAARLHDLYTVDGVVSCGRPGSLGDNRQGEVIGVIIGGFNVPKDIVRPKDSVRCPLDSQRLLWVGDMA